MKPRSNTLTFASRTVLNSPLSQQGRAGMLSLMGALSLLRDGGGRAGRPPRPAHRPHAEIVFLGALPFARTRQVARRLVQRFVGKFEGAPVDADAAARAQVLVGLHRFGR